MSSVFVGLSRTVALELTSPWSPSFHLGYILSVLDFGWNRPCIMSSFLILIEVASISFFVQVVVQVGYTVSDNWQGISVDVLPSQLNDPNPSFLANSNVLTRSSQSSQSLNMDLYVDFSV